MAVFTGTSVADELNGTGSNDTFTGLSGNDTISGGDGTDTVIFQGNRSDYLITRSGNTFTINDTVSGRDQTDTVSGVETFQFSDFTIRSTNGLTKTWISDFDGDGRSDLYWRSNLSGTTDQIWSVRSGSTIATVSATPTSFSAAAGSALLDTSAVDFATAGSDTTIGDGVADLVILTKTSTGVAWQTYDAGGVDFAVTQSPLAVSLETSERTYLGHGDTNNDGRQDLLVRNERSGEVEVFQGGTESSFYSAGSLGPLGSSWAVKGIGDLNADGTDDLLFQNSATGDIVQWGLTGTQVTSSAYLGNPGSSWGIMGVHDFDGNGTSDILFRNAYTGDIVQWATSSSGISGSAMGNVSSSWDLLGAGDFNGDGAEDLLWKHRESGMIVDWLMDGTTSTGHLLAESTASTFAFQGIGDYDGNGKADIVWRDTATNEVRVWFMDGGTYNQSTIGKITGDYTLVAG